MNFRYLSLVVVLLSLYVASSRAEEVDESDVLVLSKENFDKALEENKFLLVEFYAPWCGHCKKLTPEWAKAAKALKGDVAVAKVDATVESDLASKFEVRGYPTLKFFRSGSPMEYNGQRSAADIIAWAKKKSGPASAEVKSDDVDEFVEGKSAVVGYFKSLDGEAHQAFLKTASDGELDDFAFAHVDGAKAEKVELYAPHLDKPLTFTGKRDELKKWVLNNGYPLVDELPAAWARYSKIGLPLAILFIDPAADNKEVLTTVRAAAEQAKGKLSFSFADGVRFKQQIERMGGKTDKLPTLAAMKLNGKSNYPFTGELDTASLVSWAEGIADGSIVPTLKSEEPPADNTGPVKVIVGKTFNEWISGDKDVFLEIYAPWCGHCKSLAPTWEELGKAFAANDKVVIAKLDGVANDIPADKLEVRGFPTIKFFPAGKGVDGVMDYNGGRTLDDLKKFVNENAVNAKKGGKKATGHHDHGHDHDHDHDHGHEHEEL